MAQITQKLSYGMYVVTTWLDGEPRGCIANCAVQITSDPQTFAVSINRENFTNKCIKATKKFALSVLAEDSDPQIIGTFGFRSSEDTDKFKSTQYKVEGKLPVIADSCGYIVCDVIDMMETPTHTVFLGKMTASGTYGDRQQMTYDYYHKVIKGKSPKKAPTYVEEKTSAAAKKYVCSVCGYVHEGELPEGYTCPVCGVGKEMFVASGQ